MVGLGGEVFETVRMDVRPGRTSVDDIATDLAELADHPPRPAAAQDALIGVGVAVVGIVRRSDGLVFMAPNLGWRDEPLGKRLAVAMRTTIPIALANEADLAVIAEHRRGAARDVKNVVLLWGSVGVGGGVIIDGAPADRHRRVRRRDRTHAGQPGRPAVSLRLDRLLGDPRWAGPPCCAAPATRRKAGPRRWTP